MCTHVYGEGVVTNPYVCVCIQPVTHICTEITESQCLGLCFFKFQ